MQFKNLTMSFGAQTIFENVNLSIPDNVKVGVVGVNGAGKTTLFKLMMGLEFTDTGKIITKNGYRIDWLPQVISDDVDKIEKYFKSIECEYVFVDCFAYNEKGCLFYEKMGYHPRMITNIKKLNS